MAVKSSKMGGAIRSRTMGASLDRLTTNEWLPPYGINA